VERWRTQNAPRRSKVRPRIEPRVTCDNDAADGSTLVEVHAADEHGLAYKIASTLTALGLDIVCARIATEKNDALDVFYVTDSEGQKLSAESATLVERDLKGSLAVPASVAK